jgi:hypothetical protein
MGTASRGAAKPRPQWLYRAKKTFALLPMTERKTNMEDKSCEFQGKIFPNGGVTCIGDQCIQCSDGNWGPNEFEAELREKMLRDL